MTEKQKYALMQACRAHGAVRVALDAYATAQSQVRIAIDRAEQVAAIAAYAGRMYDRTDQVLERVGVLLQEVLDEIGDLIVELKQDTQPPEPQDFSI